MKKKNRQKVAIRNIIDLREEKDDTHTHRVNRRPVTDEATY